VVVAVVAVVVAEVAVTFGGDGVGG